MGELDDALAKIETEERVRAAWAASPAKWSDGLVRPPGGHAELLADFVARVGQWDVVYTAAAPDGTEHICGNPWKSRPETRKGLFRAKDIPGTLWPGLTRRRAVHFHRQDKEGSWCFYVLDNGDVAYTHSLPGGLAHILANWLKGA